jgi:flagellar motility protein MotE (MotC chaperone)
MTAASPVKPSLLQVWKGKLAARLPRNPVPMLIIAAGVAAAANTWVLAAPQKTADATDTRLSVSLRDDMAQRDRQLAEEKRKLDMREQAAKAAEARLAQQLASQQTDGAAAGNMPAGKAAAVSPEEEKFSDLARVYQMMKPAKAAPIFEKLDLEVQTQVIQRMRDRSAAQLMASMKPNAAAELTMSLAGREVTPQRGRAAANAANPRP